MIASGGIPIGNGGNTFDIDSIITDGTSYSVYDGATAHVEVQLSIDFFDEDFCVVATYGASGVSHFCTVDGRAIGGGNAVFDVHIWDDGGTKQDADGDGGDLYVVVFGKTST